MKNLLENFDIHLFLTEPLVRGDRVPLFRQIYRNIRQAILSRRLKTGSQMPPTRYLARELNVSRSTLINAFELLISEGYLVGKPGAGTFVAGELPDGLLLAGMRELDFSSLDKTDRNISERGRKTAEAEIVFSDSSEKSRAFGHSLTETEQFPMHIWKRIIARLLRKDQRKFTEYIDRFGIQGYPPLRRAISKYLGASRGLVCSPDQIIITTGSQQGLDLSSRVLLDNGDRAWVEDPNYKGSLGALTAGGVRIVPVPLDAEGIDVKAGKKLAGDARAAFVTPSHQFPLGTVMSFSRRLELLKWADHNSAWIIEDDYDSEFRYDGKPFPALQGLDAGKRVIYIGTFSKALFSSIRLGYLVVPADLVHSFVKMLLFTSFHAPVLEQLVLTDFINQGHFGRHIRKMRKLYAARQKFLVDEINRELGDHLEVRPTETGMHLIAWLKKGLSDAEIARKAREKDVNLAPLSFYCLKEKLPDGLILGFAGTDEKEIRRGVRRLQGCFDG
ncbi:MAG: PLP-dependent aminotransferase family protein [Pyrinomonadaceae bacterium]